MDYRAADAAYFSLLQEQATPMFERIRTTAFPQTYRALFAFCARTNFLKTAMFDMVDSENPYAFKALLRCFCEHYLKFTYLFVRFLVKKSDDPGKEYYAFCGAREMRQYAAAVVEAEALIGHRVVAELDAFIAEHFPEAADLSARDLKRRSSKFDYRSILTALRQHPNVLGPENAALARILPMYAQLSSFVHGGPASERDMYANSLEEAVAECDRDAALVFTMTASVLLFTAMAVGREYPEHLKIAANVYAVINGAHQGTFSDPTDVARDGSGEDDGAAL